MNPTSTRTLAERLSKPDFPRSSRYDPHWLLNNVMGPHVLWLTEWLSQSLELTPGMRVLDLGCGRALSSLFLAKEFGVTVYAADHWIKASENLPRIEQAGCAASAATIRPLLRLAKLSHADNNPGLRSLPRCHDFVGLRRGACPEGSA